MSSKASCNRDPGDEAQLPAQKPRDVLVEKLMADNTKMRGIIKRAITSPADSDAVSEILLSE